MNIIIPIKFRICHAITRYLFIWGTFGKEGNEPLSYIKLAKMSNEHIRNIVYNPMYKNHPYISIFEDELRYRAKHHIYIPDTYSSSSSGPYYLNRQDGMLRSRFTILEDGHNPIYSTDDGRVTHDSMKMWVSLLNAAYHKGKRNAGGLYGK